jgi:hypothetical protein
VVEYQDERQFAPATARSELMHSSLSPFAIVERLIERESPVWYRWDGNTPTLIEALKSAADREFSSEPSATADKHELGLRRRRLLWLLDRVAPESDSSIFDPFRTYAIGIYAWGRRLPPERRDELLRVPIPDESARFRIRFLQAAIVAWCVSCPDTQLDSLLEWHDYWRPVLNRHDICWLSTPTEEFYRRSAGSESRRDEMIAALRRNLSLLHSQDGFKRESARGVAWALWLQLLREVAIENPGVEARPTDTEEWIVWFHHKLSSPPYAQLAEFGRELLKGRTSEYQAQSLWIWLHGKSQWRELHSYSLFNQEPRVFERLAEIVPEDELDAWDDLVLDRAIDHGEMRAYCRWLAPKYADVLRSHFDHTDRDWGACAYQNYITKAQKPILQHCWRQVSKIPAWQAELLDRRLFGPERVRPAAIVEDTQTVGADLRLQDPFNHRSY